MTISKTAMEKFPNIQVDTISVFPLKVDTLGLNEFSCVESNGLTNDRHRSLFKSDVLDRLQTLRHKITVDAVERIIERDSLSISVDEFDIDSLRDKIQTIFVHEHKNGAMIEIHPSISDMVTSYLQSSMKPKCKVIRLT